MAISVKGQKIWRQNPEFTQKIFTKALEGPPKAGFCFFFKDPSFFNSLDNEVINSKTISSFKNILKSKLISSYQ